MMHLFFYFDIIISMKELDIHSYLKLFGVYNKEVFKSEKQIIDDFFKYLKKNKLDLNNKKDLSYFNGVLKSLFDLEMSLYPSEDVIFNIGEDNMSLGDFTYEINKNKNGTYSVKNMKINIYKSQMIMLYLNDNVKLRLFAANQVIRGLFHEIEHYKQFRRFMSNNSSKYNLRFCKEFILSEEKLSIDIKPKSHVIYSTNHDNLVIENHSNSEGLSRLSLLLDFNNTTNIKNATVHKLDMLFSTATDNLVDGNIYDRDEYIDEKFDKLIKLNPYLLKKYPILLKEYNKLGFRKTLSELVLKMNTELLKTNKLELTSSDKNILLNDIYSMYYELIYKRLKLNNPIEIKKCISLFGIDFFNDLLINLKEYYRNDRIYKASISKRKYELKCINDSDYNYLKINPKHGYIIYNNQINTILDYVIKHLYVDAPDEIKKVIVNHVIYRIPKCGYFMLKDGTKILPNDFINEYLVPRLKKNMTSKEVLDILRELVLSTKEQTHKMELEKINSDYQNICDTIKKISDTYNRQGGKNKCKSL